MLRAEILGYEPDVVTFYEAFKHAGLVMDEDWIQATARWARALRSSWIVEM